MQNFPGNQKYLIIEKLGQGAFGSAYKVLNKDNNNIYVIKKIEMTNAKEEEKSQIKNEATILSGIDSQYIVKYYDSFSDNNSFNIVMEYCNGLDLRKFIDSHRKKKKFIEKELIYQIISDICLGIKEIHSRNLIHRDLKPDNLFISGDLKIKIGDFGICKQLNNYNEYAKSQVGTLRYMAPEIIKGEKYNSKVDIWSSGCIIYELCTLNLCFESDSLNTLINNIVESKYEKINENIYGSNFQKLIDLLLNKNRNKRPDIISIIGEINKFMKKLSIEKKIELFFNNEVYEEYTIEKDIKYSLDKVKMKVLGIQTEYNFNKCFSIFIGLCFISSPILGILYIGSRFNNYMNNLLDKFISSIFDFSDKNNDEKEKFIKDNLIIIEYIKSKLSQN